jgi:hypothetical protein
MITQHIIVADGNSVNDFVEHLLTNATTTPFLEVLRILTLPPQNASSIILPLPPQRRFPNTSK